MTWWQIGILVWTCSLCSCVVGMWWATLPFPDKVERECPECLRRKMHAVSFEEECG